MAMLSSHRNITTNSVTYLLAPARTLGGCESSVCPASLGLSTSDATAAPVSWVNALRRRFEMFTRNPIGVDSAAVQALSENCRR